MPKITRKMTLHDASRWLGSPKKAVLVGVVLVLIVLWVVCMISMLASLSAQTPTAGGEIGQEDDGTSSRSSIHNRSSSTFVPAPQRGQRRGQVRQRDDRQDAAVVREHVHGDLRRRLLRDPAPHQRRARHVRGHGVPGGRRDALPLRWPGHGEGLQPAVHDDAKWLRETVVI